jgi:hypothetical protein
MPVQTSSRMAAIVDCTDALVGVEGFSSSKKGSAERDYEEEMEGVVMQLLLHFDLCYPMHKHANQLVQKYLIPALLNNNDPYMWDDVPWSTRSADGSADGSANADDGVREWSVYVGRRFVCKGSHDIMPPGFWPRVQVRLHLLTANAVVETDGGRRGSHKNEVHSKGGQDADSGGEELQLGAANVWRSGMLITARVRPSTHASGHNVSSDGGLHDGINDAGQGTATAIVSHQYTVLTHPPPLTPPQMTSTDLRAWRKLGWSLSATSDQIGHAARGQSRGWCGEQRARMPGRY